MLYFFVHFLCMYFFVLIHKKECIYFQNKINYYYYYYYICAFERTLDWAHRKCKMQDCPELCHYNCSVTIWSSSMRFIIAKQIKLLATARIITCVQFHGVFICKFHTFKYAHSVSIGFFSICAVSFCRDKSFMSFVRDIH